MEKAVIVLKNITALGLVAVAGLFAYWYFFDLPVKLIGDNGMFMLYGFIIYCSLAAAIGLFRSKEWGLFFLTCICSLLVLDQVFLLWNDPDLLQRGNPLTVFALFFLLFIFPIVIPGIFWVFRKKIFR